MLPPKEGDSLLVQSPVYAQIFLRHNGQCAKQCNVTQHKIKTFSHWSLFATHQVLWEKLQGTKKGRVHCHIYLSLRRRWVPNFEIFWKFQIWRKSPQIETLSVKRQIWKSQILEFLELFLYAFNRLDLWRTQFFLKRVTHLNWSQDMWPLESQAGCIQSLSIYAASLQGCVRPKGWNGSRGFSREYLPLCLLFSFVSYGFRAQIDKRQNCFMWVNCISFLKVNPSSKKQYWI